MTAPQPQPHKGPWANLMLRRLNDWDCSQRDLARILDVAESRVSDWIHERHEPSDEMKARMVRLLKPTAAEITPEWLLPALASDPPARPACLDGPAPEGDVA